ncbi:predicted protein [Lichtheimia corymbifera JMRC:FSU:9682]|uniref:Uncharacterized protein n=1 Tax=Lichtheimia corymbifera JMRC:FSU:9682 TaxID=1263082 RepID=A0A068RPV2_9FUNG|nr:predicted protein [Lichtheimia corymbifera JMRC:FSU:9682]
MGSWYVDKMDIHASPFSYISITAHATQAIGSTSLIPEGAFQPSSLLPNLRVTKASTSFRLIRCHHYQCPLVHIRYKGYFATFICKESSNFHYQIAYRRTHLYCRSISYTRS